MQRRPVTRPVIGITCDYNDARTEYSSPYGYAASVERVGGLPLLLPYRVELSLIPQMVDLLDGIVFSGGEDIDPAAFGQERHLMAEAVDPLREQFERSLFAEVERRRLPTLGICMGTQLINVHRGGSLVQFIPDVLKTAGDKDESAPIEHRRLEKKESPRHEVKLEPESALAKRLGRKNIEVNSSHKQSIDRLGKGLRIIATSPDGIIEGVEDPSMPLMLAVQWHPERMSDEAPHRALFEILIERAAHYHNEFRDGRHEGDRDDST
jgi:putative glutamine amidotransferase